MRKRDLNIINKITSFEMGVDLGFKVKNMLFTVHITLVM